MLALLVAVFFALGLVAVGAGALAAPRLSARHFGIAFEDPRALAFLRAMGVRDVALGVLLLLLAAAGQRGLLAWGLVASALVALVDLALVWAAGGGARARLPHALGALGLLAAALFVAARA